MVAWSRRLVSSVSAARVVAWMSAKRCGSGSGRGVGLIWQQQARDAERQTHRRARADLLDVGVGEGGRAARGLPITGRCRRAVGPASVSVVGPRMGHSGSSPGNSSSSRVMVPGPTSPNCVKPRFSFALKARTAAAVFAP